MIDSILKLAIPVANIVDRDSERKFKVELLELSRKIRNEENKPIWNGKDKQFRKGKYRDDSLLLGLKLDFLCIIELLGNEVEHQFNFKVPS